MMKEKDKYSYRPSPYKDSGESKRDLFKSSSVSSIDLRSSFIETGLLVPPVRKFQITDSPNKNEDKRNSLPPL